MQSQKQLKQALLDSLQKDEEIAVIQPPAIGQTQRQNELLMFIKPENSGNRRSDLPRQCHRPDLGQALRV